VRGLDWTLTEARIAQYAAAAGALAQDLDLPAPGRGVRLMLAGGQVLTGELIGFGASFIVFRQGVEEPPAQVFTMLITSVTDAQGRKVDGRRLEERLTSGPVPLVAGVLLEHEGATREVAYQDVVALGRVTSPDKGSRTGHIVGLVLDAIVISSHWWCGACYNSY